MNYILFDSSFRNNLLPLTFTRPVADLRVGILTIREKWELLLKEKTSTLTEPYLAVKYPLVKAETNILINGSICPNEALLAEVKKLRSGETLVQGDSIIAMCLEADSLDSFGGEAGDDIATINTDINFIKIENTWELFQHNDRAIREDFKLLTKGRKSQPLSKTNRVVNPESIFVEEGAVVEFAILNASTGPIYIGKNAEVMEGSKVRGPLAMCEHAVLKMDAKIYGATTIGPHSKVGGEVNNSIILGYSNKAHDGFLGNSVIGEWCNLGANTNNSNLKNNYASVKMWNYPRKQFVNTGLLFTGLIMGDHSKCSINTMFNTGTVVGVSSNVFGSGFPPKYIPSFTWGGSDSLTSYALDRSIDVAKRVMERRHIEFSEIDERIFRKVFDLTKEERRRRGMPN